MKKILTSAVVCFFFIISANAHAYLKEILGICVHVLKGRTDILNFVNSVSGTTIESDEIQLSPRNEASGPSQPLSETESPSFRENTKLLSEQLRAMNDILILAYRFLSEANTEPVAFFQSTQALAQIYISRNEPQNYNISNIWLSTASTRWGHINRLCTAGLEHQNDSKDAESEDNTADKTQAVMSKIKPILEGIDHQRNSHSRSSQKSKSGRGSFKMKSGSFRKSTSDLGALIKGNGNSNPRDGGTKTQDSSSTPQSSASPDPNTTTEGISKKKRVKVPPEIPPRADAPLRLNGVQSMNDRMPPLKHRQRVQSYKNTMPRPLAPPREDLMEYL